ncbi:MAG: ABC transporter permease [Gemmatimonadota bacterium]
MGKVWVVFKREYIERVRSKWFIIATLLGPVLMGLLIVVPNVLAARTKTSAGLTNVVIIDATGSDLGARVAKSLATSMPNAREPRVRSIKIERLADEEKRATAEVINREALGYVVLDANTMGGKEMRYAGRNATSLVDIGSLERTVRQSLLNMRLENEGIDPGRVAVLTNVRLETKTEKITDRGREGASGMASLFFGYAIALLLYMMIAIYGQSIMRGVLEEKTNRVAEVVVASVKPDILLTGKILGSGSVAVTQVLVWLAMSFLIYLVRVPILELFGAAPAMLGGAIRIPSVDPLVGVALFLFFILGFTFYAALFGAVGAMVSNQEDIQQAAMPVMLLLVSSIIFMSPILLAPSSTLAVTMSLLPFSAPLMMPLRMALIAVPWYEIIGSLVSVTVGSAIAIWLSARIYRVGLLMYGKRPSLKELGRWIRMA